MSDRNNFVVIFVTAPDGQFAEGLARRLVEERLAACVNIVPGLRSVFWWEGEVQESEEVLLLLKARREDVDAVAERVRGLHPYEVPEVIAAEIVAGLDVYLSWVAAQMDRG
jgi:periplasmic divalent cation tolerance protein